MKPVRGTQERASVGDRASHCGGACDRDRRAFLFTGASAAIGLALWPNSSRAAVRLLAPRSPVGPERETRTLVLVQLTGGNDGLSMVVPHGDDAYYRARSTIAVAKDIVLPLDRYRGLHPELGELRRAYERGELALVEGVGYPHPNRSHFKSMEIWHTADERGRASGEGWIGKLCDVAWREDRCAELLVHVGGQTPYSLSSSSHPAVSMQTPASYRWVATDAADDATYRTMGDGAEGNGERATPGGRSALDRLRAVLADAQESSRRVRLAAQSYRTPVAYPEGDFADSLHTVAALIDARMGARVLSVELGGFDTHNAQRSTHDALMRQLDGALSAFTQDLARTSAGRDTIVLVFSEFGRRLDENGSRGTDHGVAAPMFVLGSKVKGGLYGKHPSLTALDDGDLVHTTDFRSVYGTVIQRWFGVAHEKVLGARYPMLDCLRV